MRWYASECIGWSKIADRHGVGGCVGMSCDEDYSTEKKEIGWVENDVVRRQQRAVFFCRWRIGGGGGVHSGGGFNQV